MEKSFEGTRNKQLTPQALKKNHEQPNIYHTTI